MPYFVKSLYCTDQFSFHNLCPNTDIGPFIKPLPPISASTSGYTIALALK